jgi:hypothetical protein
MGMWYRDRRQKKGSRTDENFLILCGLYGQRINTETCEIFKASDRAEDVST